MAGGRRDNIVIGLMIILTYYLIYAFMGQTEMLRELGGLPLIDCTTSLIRDGISLSVIRTLTVDFAQTIIVVFVVVFVQNLIPSNGSRRLGAIITIVLGYMILYLFSMWVVRDVIFTERTNAIIRTFLAIFTLVCAGMGAAFASPLGGIITSHFTSEYLTNYMMNSRIVHWLADSFFISAAILFVAVALEMTVGLPYLLSGLVGIIPSVITLAVMVFLIYYMFRP